MEKEIFEKVLTLLYEYRGRAIGALLGLLFSFVFINFGFILTVFIFACIFVGYYIGRKYDQQEDLREIIDDILPPRR
ncbi:DUF2273 domain-containing protein [Selenihalanaerobacter shriftii]|uniref:Small integral membrane protein n=1 Tax=Selenihalanaerobacter shriftii TaxID=142842 RepID=A0A1T4P2Y3_9FIRM|nr:DUF2273 domain-containing protein [Selenihalanaerobacter shriftii]SJZ85636.1 Small integral membrane protein [Selenihalanaerobacter shriftii]